MNINTTYGIVKSQPSENVNGRILKDVFLQKIDLIAG
jgi:hypothetical protein